MSKFWKRTSELEEQTRSIQDRVRSAIVDEIVRTDDQEHRAELKEEYYNSVSESAANWEKTKSEDNYKLGRSIGQAQGMWLATGALGIGYGLKWLIDKFIRKK